MRLGCYFVRDEDINIDQSDKNEKGKDDEEQIDRFGSIVFESGFDAGNPINECNHGKRDVHDMVDDICVGQSNVAGHQEAGQNVDEPQDNEEDKRNFFDIFRGLGGHGCGEVALLL